MPTRAESPRELVRTDFVVSVYAEVGVPDGFTKLKEFLVWERLNLCHTHVSKTAARKLGAREAAEELSQLNLSPEIFGIAEDGSELDQAQDLVKIVNADAE